MNTAALVHALLILVTASAAAPARTATAAERLACEAKVQGRIDVIDSRLRAGYSAREGERLKERRRQLEAERTRCRQAP